MVPQDWKYLFLTVSLPDWSLLEEPQLYPQASTELEQALGSCTRHLMPYEDQISRMPDWLFLCPV